MSIKLLIYNRENKQTDITNLITSITWSGDYKSASRKLEFNLLSTCYTVNNVPVIPIEEGYMVVFYENNKELFRGFIYSVSRQSNQDISFVAYDHGQKLTDIKVAYNFKEVTANAIATQILTDYGLSIGEIAPASYPYSKIFIDVSMYESIMSAYTSESANNNKKYMILAKEGKINVIHKGEIKLELELAEGKNIINSTYSSSITNVVNKVLIVDESGNSVSSMTNEEELKLYGLFQRVLKEEENKDTSVEAKKLLKKREQSASLTGYGDTTCITGYAVTVLDNHTGLKGLFFIDTDKHTWQNGEYTIDLNINFENIMNEVSAGSDEKEETTDITDSSTSSTIDCPGNENFIKPIAGASVTSPYGNRKHPVTGVYKLHTGADLGASSGTSIKAMASGTITEVTRMHTAWGNRVVITHTGGKYATMYAHMSSITVKKGQAIKQGEEVGKVGSTGYSTGAHLHFEVWKEAKESNTTDPVAMIGKQAVWCNHTTHSTSSSTTSTSGGTRYKAEFTAYAAGDGCGWTTSSGKKADYTKKMCAAPKNFAFGTKFAISGTGSFLDGQTYTVEDRGGAIIQKGDGTYVIDILMESRSACLKFGRKTGYITVGGSTSSSSSSNVSTSSTNNSLDSKRNKVVEVAKSKVGCPYVWGATGPNSFDCSGLCVYSYKQAGITIPRTTWEQYKGGKSVPANESSMLKGDLIITNNQNHVIMYIGNGKIIHAPRAGKPVSIEAYGSYWKGVTVGVRRYIY